MKWFRRWFGRKVEAPRPVPASGRYTSKGYPAALSADDLAAVAAVHDPLIVGLFAELPEPHTPFVDQDVWLDLAALVLKMIYNTTLGRDETGAQPPSGITAQRPAAASYGGLVASSVAGTDTA